ncbi:ComEC/Rec2-related protein [Microbacterium sp. HM58-2]|nr:ComEC/Rec2-related protein [Microbacterium sp. HM58-2]
MLPLTATVWSVALLCVFLPATAPWCALGGVLAMIVVLGCLWRRQRERDAVVRGAVAAVILAASAAVAFTVVLAVPERDVAAAWDGRVVEATAEITSSATLGRDGRLWVEAQLTGLGPPGAPSAASAPVRIGVEPGQGFALGAGIRVIGEAAVTDPGERSALVIFASTAGIDRRAGGVFAVAASVRDAFVERAVRLPEPGGGLLPGLAVGDTTAVTPELNDDMRASGLSHLTAVSGANCAIVVGAVFWLVALCGGRRGLRVALAVIALAGFVVLVTPEPSVIRASVMAGVAMLTVLLGRPSAGAGMLALCTAGILIADPWLASTPGFALSVVASGALILLAPALARGIGRWMPHPVALALAVPLAAQLACGPIIALFAEQQSLVGVAANLLAAPAAPIATVVGLLACLSAPIAPLADLLAASAWLPAAWIATTAGVSARLSFAQIVLIPGIGSAVLVTVLSAAVGVVLIGPRAGGRELVVGVRIGWMRGIRMAAAGVLVVASALGGAHLLLSGPLATAATPEGWSIAACDVGQGDAVLVRSEGRIALIDTGPEPEPLQDCLSSLGIDRIDLLVLTHFDLDHVGGVAGVRGRVDAVLHGPPGESEDERLVDDLAAAGAVVTPASAGLRGVLGGAAWRVLWPQRDSMAFPAGNDASVVVEFSGGGVPRALFLGDLSAAPQRMMLRTARMVGDYDVVKVAHHGSADQDPGLYEEVSATAALFSAGAGNDYGHPRDETLDLLQAAGAVVLRTDLQGRILLAVRDGALEVWTENPP